MRLVPRIVCLALVLALVLPESAFCARAVPDSLAELRALIGQKRTTDPAVVALARRVLAHRESVRDARPADIAEALEWLGRVRLSRVEYPAADSAFQRAAALRKAERRPDLLALANALGWLAESQRVTKKLARAESTATEVLILIEERALRDTALAIRVRNTLGNVLAERGRGVRACETLAEAVRLGERQARPDSALLGQTCRNLGRAMGVAGDLRGARAAYTRAASIQERTLGPNHPEVASTLLFTAMAAGNEGDYVAQRRLAERALTIRESVFGQEHTVVAIAAATLGGALRNLGDFEGALPFYERALAIQRGPKGGSAFDLAVALNNLGVAYESLGDGRRARASFEEARAVREKAFGPGSGSNVWSRMHLANAMWLSGDLTSARTEIDSAIARVDTTHFDDSALDLSEALQIQGGIAHSQGQIDVALASFERGFAVNERMLGSASPKTIDALARRAIVRAQVGRVGEAWADARRLESGSRQFLQLSARSLSEYEALTLERNRASGLDLMLSLAADPARLDPIAPAELADALYRARLLVLDQLADERRALPRGNVALAASVEELEDAREALARTMVEALRQGRSMDSTVVNARLRRESAERALAARSDQFELGLRRSDVGFAEVAAALPPSSALISLVRHTTPERSLQPWDGSDSSRRLGRRYSALVLRSGERVPTLVALGEASPLEDAVARWLEACATPPSDKPALARAAERRCDALGRAVRALAWDPIVRATGGAERVFVVPDGALHAVNFLALPDAQSGHLVDREFVLHRLTAERDLLPWIEGSRRGAGLLAMGGADFDHVEGGATDLLAASIEPVPASRSSLVESSRVRFTALPQTAAEVEQVTSLWRASGAPDAADALSSSGAAASEATFKRLAPGRRVLHVATHGFALGGGERGPAPTGSRAIGSVVLGASRERSMRRAPLLPGLALSGANTMAAAGTEDGFLTAEEITSLDLTGTEWAVLSACETGLSDPSATEAVQGLQRAFRRAGVHTVVMSLWAVDDEATRTWMRQLYSARLVEHLDTAASVRSACRELRRARRGKGLDTHPFHWAAFVAAGDWR